MVGTPRRGRDRYCHHRRHRPARVRPRADLRLSGELIPLASATSTSSTPRRCSAARRLRGRPACSTPRPTTSSIAPRTRRTRLRAQCRGGRRAGVGLPGHRRGLRPLLDGLRVRRPEANTVPGVRRTGPSASTVRSARRRTAGARAVRADGDLPRPRPVRDWPAARARVGRTSSRPCCAWRVGVKPLRVVADQVLGPSTPSTSRARSGRCSPRRPFDLPPLAPGTTGTTCTARLELAGVSAGSAGDRRRVRRQSPAARVLVLGHAHLAALGEDDLRSWDAALAAYIAERRPGSASRAYPAPASNDGSGGNGSGARDPSIGSPGASRARSP